VSDIAQTFAAAFALLRHLDRELIDIVALSPRVSLSASVIAMVLAARLGALLSEPLCRPIVLTNTFLRLRSGRVRTCPRSAAQIPSCAH
jgi:tungstate transport system permease protein